MGLGTGGGEVMWAGERGEEVMWAGEQGVERSCGLGNRG